VNPLKRCHTPAFAVPPSRPARPPVGVSLALTGARNSEGRPGLAINHYDALLIETRKRLSLSGLVHWKRLGQSSPWADLSDRGLIQCPQSGHFEPTYPISGFSKGFDSFRFSLRGPKRTLPARLGRVRW
jgi:hypothetical protein